MEENMAIMRGEDPSKESVNTVKDVPDNFKKWVSENGERIASAEKKGTLPYFLRDNEAFWRVTDYSTTMASLLSMSLSPTQIKDITAIQEAVSKISREHPEYFSKGFGGIVAVSEKATYMNTTMNGVISINFATDENGFNAGEAIVSAFKKLSNNGTLTKDEEYSIEVLWHEILHNKSLNTTVLPPVETTDKGFARTVAETINQLDARHTYGTLLNHLGRKPIHRDWVIGNGYGYNETVGNLRLLLKAANINESEFVKRADAILMKDYMAIDKKISDLLIEMYKGKVDIKWLFGMIERKDFANLLKVLN